MTTYAGLPVFAPFFVDVSGDPAAAVSIDIYLRGKGPAPDGDGSLARATVYTDRLRTTGGTAAPYNPVVADSRGTAEFYCAPGDYDAVANGVTYPFTVFPDIAEIAASGVTLDTDQTITGSKTWAGANIVRSDTEFDVRAWGSGVGVGNAANDTAAWQAACTEAQAVQGTVLLPRRLLLNAGAKVYNPMGVRGQHRYGSKILTTSAFPVDGYVLHAERDMANSLLSEELHVPGLTLEDFTVYGNARQNRVNGFKFDYFDRIKARNVQCRWLKGSAWILNASVRESHFDGCDAWGCGDTANDRPVLDMRDRGTADGHNLNRWTNFTFGLNCGDGLVIGRAGTGSAVRANFFEGTIHGQTDWITTGNDNEYGIDGVTTERPSSVTGVPIRIIDARLNDFSQMRVHLPGRGLPIISVEPGQAGTVNSAMVSDSILNVFPRGSSGYSSIGVTATTATDTFAVATNARHDLSTGSRVQFTATSFPGGISAATDYYALRTSPTAFKVATTRANAVAGTAIDVTTAGSGVFVAQFDYGVAVDAAADTLTAPEHILRTTARVRVASNGGTVPGGLAVATDYFVIAVTDDTFKLATTKADARLGTAIDITSAGTGVVYVETQEFPVDVEVGATATMTFGINNFEATAPKRAFVRAEAGNVIQYDPLIAQQLGGPFVEHSSGVAHTFTFPGGVIVSAGNMQIANNAYFGALSATGGFMGLVRIATNNAVLMGNISGTSTPTSLYAALQEAARLSEPTDGNTALLLRRNVGGTLSIVQVSMGATDSGGTGFKSLRVPN